MDSRNRQLSKFDGNSTGPNIGDSKIYASIGDETLIFEAKQISFDLHHEIERAIRKAEKHTAEATRYKIIREIEERR